MKKNLNEPEIEKTRIDKWLCAARFFKTRALALKAVQQGKVRYNGQKPTPSREVKLDAMITITVGNEEKTVMVTGLDTERHAAPVAQLLYQETAESLAKREQSSLKHKEQKLFHQTAPRPSKKPEKDARRKMRSLRRQNDDEEM